MDGVEEITADGKLAGLIVRHHATAEATTFLTDPQLNLQAGLIVYPGGGEIPRHKHHPVERTTRGTSEAVLVRDGACAVDFYDAERNLVASRDLTAGDLVMLFSGGHGFRVHRDTVLLEIKQGPYPGLDEKERF